MSLDTEIEDSALTTSDDTEKAYPPDKNLGRRFLWVSILVVFLVVIGGIVRLTDSGLSIPEWPVINGSLLPPITEDDWEAVYKTYHRVIEEVEVDSVYHNAYPGIIPIGRFKQMFALEYFHRFVAAVLGILYLVLLIKVMRRKQKRSRFGVRMWVGLALLILQAVMGGIVVKYDLQAEFLAVHLGLAFALFGLLYWTSMNLRKPPDKYKTYHNKFLSRIAWSAVGALFLQVLSGAVVAGTEAGLSWNTWPLIGDHLIPPPSVMWRSYMGILNFIHNTVLVQFIHRWWAFVAFIMIIFLVFYSLKFKITSRCRIAFRVITSVVALQIILGIITLLTKVQPTLGVLHLTLGLILFGNMLYITYELKNHEVKLA